MPIYIYMQNQNIDCARHCAKHCMYNILPTSADEETEA